MRLFGPVLPLVARWDWESEVLLNVEKKNWKLTGKYGLPPTLPSKTSRYCNTSRFVAYRKSGPRWCLPPEVWRLAGDGPHIAKRRRGGGVGYGNRLAVEPTGWPLNQGGFPPNQKSIRCQTGRADQPCWLVGWPAGWAILSGPTDQQGPACHGQAHRRFLI